MTEAIRAVIMPKWGLAMTEGMVAAWHVAEGERVGLGDDLLEIETTKITNVLESPAAGTLRRRVADDGETVAVGALLGVVADAKVADSEIDAFIERFNEAFQVAAAAEGESAPQPEIVEAGGWRLNYLKTGDEGGPPLILVHGFGGDLNNWLFNQPALSEAHTVYALDLPGHGRSGKDVGTGDLAALSSALAGFLDALDIGRAHLVGHSLGGAVILDAALQESERAASVTLIAPAGLGAEINGDFIEGFISAARRKEMKTVLQSLFADPGLVSRTMVEDVLKFKRLDGAESALRTIADAVFPHGRQANQFAGRLASLPAPVQIVWGGRDRIVPASHAEHVQDAVSVHIIEDAGHMAHMERAVEVNTLIAAATEGSAAAV